MSARGFRNALNSIVPNWLANRPGFNTGFKVLYVVALMSDIMLEAGLEGLRASWPGRGTSSALGLVGQSRGIVRGEAESKVSYAKRLRAWLDTWANAGSAEVLAQQIQAYLANHPIVRVVDRAGNWVTANQDGTTSFQVDTAWNWDSVSDPARAGWWSDLWIIITPSEFAVYSGGLADPAWVAAWSNPNGLGIGHQVSRAQVDTILTLVHTWKGAHTWVEAILFSTNPALFAPGNLSLAGNPDGTWGHWSKNVHGVQVPARTTNIPAMSGGGTVRYWEPQGGG